MALSPQYKQSIQQNMDASVSDPQDIVQRFKANQLEGALTPELDPLKDLSPFERSLKDVIAGKSKTVDKSALYFTGPNVDKTCEDIIIDQYGPRAMVVDKAIETAKQSMQAPQAHGGVSYPSLGLTANDIEGVAQAKPGLSSPGNAFTPEYQATEQALQSELDRYPVPNMEPHQVEAPNTGKLILGTLLGLLAPGAIPQIIQQMGLDAKEQADYLDKLDQAKYASQVHGSDKVIAALNQKLRTMQEMGTAQARFDTQTSVANANNETKANIQQAKDFNMMSRDEKRIASREEIAHMNDATRNRITDLKDPEKQIEALGRLGYKPEIAREMVYSDEFNKMARTQKTKIETSYLQRSLDDRLKLLHSQQVNANLQSAYIQARTNYTNELTKYIPQTEALKYAALNALVDYRNRSLGLRESEYDSELDTKADTALEAGLTASLEELDTIDSLLKSGYDQDGNALNDGTRAALQAKRGAISATSKRIEEQIAKNKKEREFAKAKAQEKRKAVLPFSKGKRPAPMGGTVPVDPTGNGFERVKNLGGSVNVNPYL